MHHLSAADRIRARRAGSSNMILRRSESVMTAQRVISSSHLAHPLHSPVRASITHTLMQGDSMRLSSNEPG
jgi:hypothetical protein